MIRIVRSRELNRLRERDRQLADFEKAQSEAVEALGAMDRKARRRAHRELWSGLPARDGSQ